MRRLLLWAALAVLGGVWWFGFYNVVRAFAITGATARVIMYQLTSTECQNYGDPPWECLHAVAVYPECFSTGINRYDVAQWDCVAWFDQAAYGADRRCVFSAGIGPAGGIIWKRVQSCALMN